MSDAMCIFHFRRTIFIFDVQCCVAVLTLLMIRLLSDGMFNLGSTHMIRWPSILIR